MVLIFNLTSKFEDSSSLMPVCWSGHLMLRRGVCGIIFLIRGMQREEGFLRSNLATLGTEDGRRSECGQMFLR